MAETATENSPEEVAMGSVEFTRLWDECKEILNGPGPDSQEFREFMARHTDAEFDFLTQRAKRGAKLRKEALEEGNHRETDRSLH